MMTHATLTTADFNQLAAQFGVEARALRAVQMVEAPAGGFLPSGDPRILFERHVMFRRLQIPERKIDPSGLSADHPELCGPTWDPKAFPYGSEAHQWERVGTVTAWALAHDRDRWESYKKSAYESCSWGLFQIMGENHLVAGFADIYGMVAAMRESEARQMQVALRWMQAAGILPHLQRRNWPVFSLRYNGAGQVDAYAGKLEEAYRRLG